MQLKLTWISYNLSNISKAGYKCISRFPIPLATQKFKVYWLLSILHRNPSIIVTLTSLRVSSIVTLPLIKCIWEDF